MVEPVRRRGDGPVVRTLITEVAARPAVRTRDGFFRRALVVADLVASSATFGLVAVVAGVTPRPALALGVAFVVIAGKLAGLYDRDPVLIRKAATVEEIPALWTIATVLALLVVVAQDVVLAGELRGAEVLLLWLGLALSMILCRTAARSFSLHHTETERCVVVGDADACAHIADKLTNNRHVNTSVIGYVPLGDRIRAEDPTPLGALDDLDTLLVSAGVHRVIIAPRDQDSDAPLDVVRRVKALGVRVSVLPRIFEVVGSAVAFDEVDGVTVLGIRRFGLTRGERALKRSFDVAGALTVTVLAAPLLAAIALAIRLDSPGPVLFRQRRVGLEGRVFGILKFRTMAADAEARKAELLEAHAGDLLFKMVEDPRITRVGRWLRGTSLDELPQLLNVLRGDMSLVGPRPLVLDEDQHVKGWHRGRLELKPGMTGPWQILGSGRIPFYEMVKIDYLYVANWSLWNDVKILLRTVPYVFSRGGM